ncbi:uncharacterized protein BT62DRAFT_1007582 [Guyanagaster necrorhizus]|uniref:Uncharacterized protein n=1 Tax=Guyanagaster necrorhizus TaxID=856835 RepID=A0A9P7VRG5_9AGAR|nr:uncharacterized protein BT62DRAFT_1007582 [Guyanagaster necrorhizus MCA 3950]KAG7444584.1 hypothetical protein BT62DRAFT_1007582 [Guyanagaster necrorhizus MCA 3950]
MDEHTTEVEGDMYGPLILRHQRERPLPHLSIPSPPPCCYSSLSLFSFHGLKYDEGSSLTSALEFFGEILNALQQNKKRLYSGKEHKIQGKKRKKKSDRNRFPRKLTRRYIYNEHPCGWTLAEDSNLTLINKSYPCIKPTRISYYDATATISRPLAVQSNHGLPAHLKFAAYMDSLLTFTRIFNTPHPDPKIPIRLKSYNSSSSRTPPSHPTKSGVLPNRAAPTAAPASPPQTQNYHPSSVSRRVSAWMRVSVTIGNR